MNMSSNVDVTTSHRLRPQILCLIPCMLHTIQPNHLIFERMNHQIQERTFEIQKHFFEIQRVMRNALFPFNTYNNPGFSSNTMTNMAPNHARNYLLH